MSILGEVSYEEIARLRDTDLTDLVRRLISLECDEFGVGAYHHVNLKINIPDGGEDGRVYWHFGPAETRYLPARLCIFQIKVGITPAAAGVEVLDVNGAVKRRISAVLSAGGAYVLVSGRPLEQAGIDDRVTSIADGLLSGGVTPAEHQIRVIDANQLRDWTNRYVAAIAFVLSKSGRLPPPGTETWEGIAAHEEYSSSYSKGDPDRDQAENAVRSFLAGTDRLARVYGMAGLGKTRLVIEAARPRAEHPKLRGVLFADASMLRDQVVIFASQCRQLGCSGVLIVDNCDEDMHSALARESKHPNSRLRILTIGNEPPPPLQQIPNVELKPVVPAVIKQQINAICPGLPAADVDFITQHLAEGFPQMAVLLAKARLGEVSDIRDVLRADLIARLVGLDPRADSEPLRVLRLCAIFSRLGFDAERAQDYRAMAEFDGVLPDRFFEHAQAFLRRGILTKVGRFIEVRPKPLAWRLAADWWAACSPEKVTRLLAAGINEEMTNALCERVRMLDGVPDIADLVGRLCQPAAPFGRAELLNSELGSRLFRAFSEVNPTACVNAIHSAFDHYSSEAIRQDVGPGRRNLVWALERLAFWERTYEMAAKTLFRFALGENETWSNNATGVLTGLFSPLLSGTQAPPQLRIRVLESFLDTYGDHAVSLVLKCLEKALKSGHYSRTAGSEQQGTRTPQQDWRPAVWQQLFDYWDAAVAIVMRFIPHPVHGVAAVNALAHQVRGLFLAGRLELLERVLNEVKAQPTDRWPEVVDSLSVIRRHDLKGAPAEAVTFVERWLTALKPVDLRDRLLVEVSQPPWDHVEGPNGSLVDASAERAADLGLQTCDSFELLKSIDVLLFGEQRQTFVFAKEVGAHSSRVERLAATTLIAYRRRPTSEWNYSFIAGLISGILHKPHGVRVAEKIIRCISTRTDLIDLLVPTCIAAQLNCQHLRLIEAAIEAGTLRSANIRALAYGRATENLTPAEVASFSLAVSVRGGAFAWAALDILSMYCHGRADRRSACGKALLELLEATEFSHPSSVMDIHHWSSTAKSLIKEQSGDRSPAERIAKKLSTSISAQRFDVQHSKEIQELASELLDARPDLWPQLALPLLSEKWEVVHAAHSILGPQLGDKNERLPIQSVSDDILFDWCLANGPHAAAALIEVYPPFHGSDDFSPLVIRVLEGFATDDVFDAFHTNLFSFTWWGSPTPYYQRLLSALKTLESQTATASLRVWLRRQITSCEAMLARQAIEDAEDL